MIFIFNVICIFSNWIFERFIHERQCSFLKFTSVFKGSNIYKVFFHFIIKTLLVKNMYLSERDKCMLLYCRSGFLTVLKTKFAFCVISTFKWLFKMHFNAESPSLLMSFWCSFHTFVYTPVFFISNLKHQPANIIETWTVLK